MIVNTDFTENKYKCGHTIAKYLVYKCHLPVLSMDDNSYYFSNTESLKKALKTMPLHLKLLDSLSGKGGKM